MTDMTDTHFPDDMPKAVLITGAAHRIGRALALDLASAGWAVAIHYNTSADAARTLVDEITNAGGRADMVAGDLACEQNVETLVARASAAIGPLGCLINNASIFENDSPETATRASWDAHMETNLRAPFVLTQAFARALSDGQTGAVINIIDQRVWNLTPYFTSYSLSKAGLWALTQTLAQALAPRIRVNAIGPGPTLPSERQSEEDFQRQWRAMPLGRPVDVAEIAAAVRFILGARAMTGQMIALDSGQHLGWAPAPASGPEE